MSGHRAAARKVLADIVPAIAAPHADRSKGPNELLPNLLIDLRPAVGSHGERGIGRYVRGLAATVARFPDDLVDRIWGFGVPGPSMDVFGSRAVVAAGTREPGWVPSWAYGRRASDAALRTSRSGSMHATDPQRPWTNPRIRSTVTVYDLIPLREPQVMASWRVDHQIIYRSYLRQIASADRIVAISQATAEDVQERLAIDEDRIDIVYPLVEQPVEVRRVDPTEPTFICVGALDPHKQPELALRAFAVFNTRFGIGRLRYIGPADAGSAARLRELASALGVMSSVAIEGRLSDPDLEEAYATATALVLTSRIEGFGLPAVEAALRGVPVIAVRTPAALETLGGVASIIAGDPEAIADAMTHPVTPSALQVQQIAERFSITSATRSLADAYRSVLG